MDLERWMWSNIQSLLEGTCNSLSLQSKFWGTDQLGNFVSQSSFVRSRKSCVLALWVTPVPQTFQLVKQKRVTSYTHSSVRMIIVNKCVHFLWGTWKWLKIHFKLRTNVNFLACPCCSHSSHSPCCWSQLFLTWELGHNLQNSFAS